MKQIETVSPTQAIELANLLETEFSGSSILVAPWTNDTDAVIRIDGAFHTIDQTVLYGYSNIEDAFRETVRQYIEANKELAVEIPDFALPYIASNEFTRL